MLLCESINSLARVEDVIVSALVQQIHNECKDFLSREHLFSDCLLTTHKEFRKSYLIGLKSYNILLFNNFLQVVLLHDNYVKQFDFPVRDTPSYHEILVQRAKNAFSKRHVKPDAVLSLTKDFIINLEKLL